MKIPIQNNSLQLNHPIQITINRGKGQLSRFIWHLRRETTIGFYCTEQQNALTDAYEGQFFPSDSNHIRAHPVRLLPGKDI